MADIMEQLAKALRGEDPQEIQPPLAPVQEAATDAELAQTNQEAKSPYQKTNEELMQDQMKQQAERTLAGNIDQEVPTDNPVSNAAKAEDNAGEAQELTPMEQFLQKRNQLDEKYQKDIKEARKSDARYGLAANLAKALGSLGQASVQRNAGVDVGIDKFAPVKGPDTAAQLKADRAARLNKLKEDAAILQAIEKAKKGDVVSDLDKAKAEKLRAEAAKLGREGKESSRKPTEGEKTVDREFAKKFTDWQTEGRSDYEVNSKIFEDAMNQLKKGKVDTGTLSGIGARIPGYRSETRELESTVRKAINGMLRATLGAQFTEKEGERIFQQTFDPSASEEANLRNMQAELDKLNKRKAAMDDMSRYYKENKTMAGYDAPTETPGSEEKPKSDAPYGNTVERNGKNYKWNPVAGKYQLIK